MKTSIKKEKHFLEFDMLDPQWCLDQAESIISKYPYSERSNVSGKFFKNYQGWIFHKTSSLSLIQTFGKFCQKYADSFKEQFSKKLEVEFIRLNLVEDASEEICIWHKDGYFFDGQMHLTVLGNACVEVQNNNKIEFLHFPNGTFWYLNGSRYYHRIVPTKGRRIEICAPISPRRESVKIMKKALVKSPEKRVDGNNSELLVLQRKYVHYILKAIENKKASNLEVADFCVD